MNPETLASLLVPATVATPEPTKPVTEDDVQFNVEVIPTDGLPNEELGRIMFRFFDRLSFLQERVELPSVKSSSVLPGLLQNIDILKWGLALLQEQDMDSGTLEFSATIRLRFSRPGAGRKQRFTTVTGIKLK